MGRGPGGPGPACWRAPKPRRGAAASREARVFGATAGRCTQAWSTHQGWPCTTAGYWACRLVDSSAGWPCTTAVRRLAVHVRRLLAVQAGRFIACGAWSMRDARPCAAASQRCPRAAASNLRGRRMLLAGAGMV